MTEQTIHTTVRQQRVQAAVVNETTTVAAQPATETITAQQPNRTTHVVYAGVPGPEGPEGPQGPPGAAGSAPQAYVHTQNAASTVWTVTHNLGFRPGGVTAEDSAGTEIVGDRTDPDANTTVLTFGSATGGVAYLS